MKSPRPMALGALLIGLAAVAPVAAPAVSPAWAQETPPPTSESGDGAPLYNGTNPDRKLKAFSPFAVVQHPRDLDPAMRGVRLRTDRIEVVQGGQLVMEIPFRANQVVGFQDVVAALARPDWIGEPEPGLFVLNAAFAQAPSTSVRFVAPAVKEIRLVTNPGVFLGGRGAEARYEGVKVTSWDPATGAPSEDVEAARPFVVYEESSKFDIAGSDFGYLGSDRVAAYGVSWRTGGTTGEVTNSVFHHCFFGAYTYEGRDIVYRNNVFRDNLFYGLDPHDATRGLVVEHNEAYGNGSHGIIFSQFVTDGIVRGNYTHHNGGSGIVMDQSSDRNLITENRVEHNQLDGIVMLGSSTNQISRNTVKGNRIGLRANHAGSANVFEENHLEGNAVGIHAYDGAWGLAFTGNTVTGNRDVGIILDAPRTTLRAGRIAGSPRGLEIRAASVVTDLRIDGAREGVVVRNGGEASLDKLNVTGGLLGVRLEKKGKALLTDSTVTADDPTRGPLSLGAANTLTGAQRPIPTPWLAFAGIVALLSAVALESLVWGRDRRERARAKTWSAA